VILLLLEENHREYWATITRFDRSIFIDGVLASCTGSNTSEFPWFATWAPSKRPRFPLGRRPKVSPLVGWVVTRKQMMAEPDLTKTLDDGSIVNIDYSEEIPHV
jgi:hypothetical protein